ncbi:MAG: secretin and TonB N-terminal domain-containing protein [Myxococcota bacterium]
MGIWWAIAGLFLATADEDASTSTNAVLIRPGGIVVDADAADQPLPRSTAARINLSVQEADIKSVLRLFAEFGVNIVVADGVEGTVTAQLADVPWDEALAAILAAEGLTARAFGENILMVEPLR